MEQFSGTAAAIVALLGSGGLVALAQVASKWLTDRQANQKMGEDLSLREWESLREESEVLRRALAERNMELERRETAHLEALERCRNELTRQMVQNASLSAKIAQLMYQLHRYNDDGDREDPSQLPPPDNKG